MPAAACRDSSGRQRSSAGEAGLLLVDLVSADRAAEFARSLPRVFLPNLLPLAVACPLSLHDALPICVGLADGDALVCVGADARLAGLLDPVAGDPAAAGTVVVEADIGTAHV